MGNFMNEFYVDVEFDVLQPKGEKNYYGFIIEGSEKNRVFELATNDIDLPLISFRLGQKNKNSNTVEQGVVAKINNTATKLAIYIELETSRYKNQFLVDAFNENRVLLSFDEAKEVTIEGIGLITLSTIEKDGSSCTFAHTIVVPTLDNETIEQDEILLKQLEQARKSQVNDDVDEEDYQHMVEVTIILVDNKNEKEIVFLRDYLVPLKELLYCAIKNLKYTLSLGIETKEEKASYIKNIRTLTGMSLMRYSYWVLPTEETLFYEQLLPLEGLSKMGIKGIKKKNSNLSSF